MSENAAQDRVAVEREAESEAFLIWCDDNGISNPTPDDEVRYADEVVDKQERAAEDRAEERANGGTGYW